MLQSDFFDKDVRVLVHRLVAWTFLPSPTEEQTTVDHIDRYPSRNVISNLRWATPVEQSANRSTTRAVSVVSTGVSPVGARYA